jgi:drug/metabolite transporter (DMT)-like permease
VATSFSSQQRWWGIALLVLANFGFSAKAVIIKLLYQYQVDTISVIALRMLFSLPFLLLALFWLRRPTAKTSVPLTKKEWWKIAGLGILGYYVSSMLDFLGLQYISASAERLILFTYPSIVLLLSFWLYKKRISKVQYMALALTYLGVVLAFVADKGIGQQHNWWKGSLLVGGCAFTFALFVVWTSKLVHKVGSARFSTYALLAATAPALVQAWAHNGWHIFHHPATVYWLATLMALAATVIPIYLIVEGMRIVGAGNSGIIGFVGPVFTILLEYLFLDQLIGFWQMVGTAIVLLGVFLIGWKGK